MLALHPAVLNAIWPAVKALIPDPPKDTHPLGCHRRRVPDRTCFEGILIRLVTGCSWDVAARIVKIGETTLRRRRDEWVRAGVFGRLAGEALEAYDRAIGLDLSEVTIDGSQHKAPAGGEGTGKNSTDRGKLGWKWSLATDAKGVPIAWAPEAANRHDSKLLEETLDVLDARGYEVEVGVVHLDRGYDFPFVRNLLEETGIEPDIPRRRTAKTKRVDRRHTRIALGERWGVERANSWLTNFGQLRRNTDRKLIHREASLGGWCLSRA
jgi:transposase